MNWFVFSDLCEKKVFPAITGTEKNAVLFLNSATYHTALDEEDLKPVQSWNKEEF